jgi:hypothetical protein
MFHPGIDEHSRSNGIGVPELSGEDRARERQSSVPLERTEPRGRVAGRPAPLRRTRVDERSDAPGAGPAGRPRRAVRGGH